jgi:hypothetical protein
MLFVPFIPPQASSPRAQELARKVEETITQFRQQHPDMSAFEVRSALRQARCAAGVSPRGPLLAFAIAAAIAVGLSLQLFQRHATPEAPAGAGQGANPWMLPTLAIAIVLFGVFALVAARR